MTYVPRSWAATAEELRLQEARAGVSWRAWGPYLSERQWGTVRGDYSEDGEAWSYFTHDQARSRAYRCGDDGLAGISDDNETLCLALALWNERDPILKERLFGLTNVEGNHVFRLRQARNGLVGLGTILLVFSLVQLGGPRRPSRSLADGGCT